MAGVRGGDGDGDGAGGGGAGGGTDLDPGGNPLPPGYRQPSMGGRYVARLIDSLFLIVPLLGLGALIGGREANRYVFLIAVVYEAGFLVWRRQTLGKLAMRIHVVDHRTGERVRPGAAVVRTLVWWLPAIVTGLVTALEPWAIVGVLVILGPAFRGPPNRGLHDLAAGTVVTLPPATAGA